MPAPAALPAATRVTSLVEVAHEYVLEKITKREFQDGERIVIEEIAEELGISRIPVREALARLHAEHVLEYERNKGYKVMPKADYRMLYEARLVIEPSAIRYGGHKVTAKQLEELRAINRKISRLRTGKRFKQYMEFLKLNDQFHLAVVRICQNRLITEAYETLSYGPQFARHTHARGIPDLENNALEHERIIEALQRQDIAAAVSAAERHIEAGLKRFESYWQQSGDGRPDRN